MSRAFVNEDAGGAAPRRGYGLPTRDDPQRALDALFEDYVTIGRPGGEGDGC